MATTRISRDTATHPEGTTYDVLVPSHAARRRGVKLDEAIQALQYMHDEGLIDAIMVAVLPSGERLAGCTGDWEFTAIHWESRRDVSNA